MQSLAFFKSASFSVEVDTDGWGLTLGRHICLHPSWHLGRWCKGAWDDPWSDMSSTKAHPGPCAWM